MKNKATEYTQLSHTHYSQDSAESLFFYIQKISNFLAVPRSTQPFTLCGMVK